MLRYALPFAGILLAAPVLHAQTIVTPPVEHLSNDVVTLKDGTVLRGTVREMTPNQSLKIAQDDGQSRTIEWKDIERVDIDRAKAAPIAPPQAAAVTMVHVEDATDGMVIQELAAASAGWETVCSGPCDRALATGGLYRIDAPGIRKSKPFRVEGATTTLHVNTASSAGFAGGLALLIGGAVLFVNGISLVIVALIDQNIITTGSYNAFVEVGGVLGGVGAVCLIAGLFVAKGNARTTVGGATTLRVPAWREMPLPQPSSRFGAITFPALSGSF